MKIRLRHNELFIFVDLSHIPVSARLRWSFESLLSQAIVLLQNLSLSKSKRTTDVVTDFRFQEVESERLLIGWYHSFLYAGPSEGMFTVPEIFERLYLLQIKSSSPGDFHPQALTDPYVNLSIHTALLTQSMSLQTSALL